MAELGHPGRMGRAQIVGADHTYAQSHACESYPVPGYGTGVQHQLGQLPAADRLRLRHPADLAVARGLGDVPGGGVRRGAADHDRGGQPGRPGVAGDQPDRLGDQAPPARLRMGPVADLGPRGVAAQPLQPDRAEAAAVVGVGDAPDHAGAAGGELPGGLQVAQRVGAGVGAGQGDQPVPGPRVGAGLDDPLGVGLGERPQHQPGPAARPGPARGAAYAGRPGSCVATQPSASSPRWSSSRRTVPSKTNPAAAATRREPQLPTTARQRSVVSPEHVEGVVPDQPDRALIIDRPRAPGCSTNPISAQPGSSSRRFTRPQCWRTPSRSASTVQASPARRSSRSGPGRRSPRRRAAGSRRPGSGTLVVQRIVSGSRLCSTIAGRSLAAVARSVTPAAWSTRIGTPSGNGPGVRRGSRGRTGHGPIQPAAHRDGNAFTRRAVIRRCVGFTTLHR